MLKGKKALVTGGKRSIGRGIVLALAEAGYDLGINDLERDQDVEETLRLVRERGRSAAFFQADIADGVQVQSMIDAFLDYFGRIDVLVNNPYYSNPKPFLDIAEEDWDRTFNVCLKGFFLCSQRAARIMVGQGEGGAITSVSSVHADVVWKGNTCYGVSKAGILRLTRSMAVELGPHGIRCNAVLPGYMDTEHSFGSLAPVAEVTDKHPLFHYTPSFKPSTPEDIGRAVAFLSSPAAGNINGISMPLDGGLLAT